MVFGTPRTGIAGTSSSYISLADPQGRELRVEGRADHSRTVVSISDALNFVHPGRVYIDERRHKVAPVRYKAGGRREATSSTFRERELFCGRRRWRITGVEGGVAHETHADFVGATLGLLLDGNF